MKRRIDINGVIHEMTAEEIAGMEQIAAMAQVVEQPGTERMDQIEAALIELAAMIAGGEQDG